MSALDGIFKKLENEQQQRLQEFQKKQALQRQMNARLDRGPITQNPIQPIQSTPSVGAPSLSNNGWDWGEFGQSFVRSTGKIIDTLVPFTDPIQQGVMKDMNKNEWFSENTRDWLNQAFEAPDSTKQKVLDGITEIGTTLIPIAGAYKVADMGLDALNKIPQGMKALNLSKGNSKILDEVQRGAGAGALWGTQNEINRALNGEDVSLGSAALNIGIETGLGGVLDAVPLVWRLWRSGKNVKEIAQETGIPEANVEELLSKSQQDYSYNGPTVNTTDAQVINPKALQLNAPPVEPVKPFQYIEGNNPTQQLEQTTQGLPEPYSMYKPRTSDEVKINGTPLLNQPKGVPNTFKNEDIDSELQSLNEMLDQERKAYVSDNMQDVDATIQRVADGEAEWKTIQELQQQAKKIQSDYGKIYIPKENQADWFDKVPARFRAGKTQSNQAYDIYKAADEEGFTSVDEFINYLQNLDNALKTKKTNVVPKHAKINENQYQELVKGHEASFNQSDSNKGINDLIERMKGMKTYNELYQNNSKGEPLSFKKEKFVKTDKVYPLNYTKRLDKNETVAKKVEGEYETKPTNEGVRVTPKNIEKVVNDLQFKTTKVVAKEKPLQFKKEVISKKKQSEYADFTEIPKQNDPKVQQALEGITNKLNNSKNTADYLQSLEIEKTTLSNMLKSNAITKQQHDSVLKDIQDKITEVEATFVKKEPTPSNVVEFKQPEPKAKPVKHTKSEPNERSFYNTVSKSEKTSPEFQKKLEEFDKHYIPMSNKEMVDYANRYVKRDIEKAYQFVKNARKFDPRHVTVGHRLIDEYQKRGEYDKALDVVERLAEQGTKAGQSIQAYSIYNRLSAQGQLLRAQRIVNKVNETQGTNVQLTPEVSEKIAHAADSLQKFTGQEEVGKDVLNIVDKWKKGEAPSDDDVEKIKEFFSEAKKFVSDLDPKATPPKPQKINDVRTRDKVIDFMSKQEEVAKKRLRQRMNRANSLPVDVFYDLTIIGASKIAKGTVKLADFSEQMVKEYGDHIKPYVKQIYNKAVETFNLQSSNMTSKRLSEVEKIVNKALKDKQLAEEQVKAVQMYLKDYLSMTGDAKLEASMNLQATLQLLERPTIAGKIATAQTIAQLLNPKTMVRNALGNELFYRVEQLNKLVATPIDIVKSKLTGSERTVTFKTNAQGKYWKYWMQGLKAGWRGVNPMGLQTAYDLGPQAFRSKYNPMKYLEKALGATLRSFDNAGYMRAYDSTLGELATLRAMNEGLKGKALKEAAQKYMREADVNIMKIADEYGKYATFQDNTMLSTALQKTKKGLNKVSTLGITDEFGAGDLILKYPKTPGNLIMRALEYSPAGFIRSAHMINNFKKIKSFDNNREITLSLTRAIVGTGGFSMLGYVLADKGILTSSGHSDYEVSTLERNAGKQGNSINASALLRFIQSGFNLKETKVQEGDTFITYDWAQPVSMAIALGTGVNQSVKEEKELKATDAVKKAGDSAFKTIIDQSVLSGLNDFLASYPGRTMSDRFADVAKGAAGSFVPTFLNQLRQLSDNTTRNTYSPNFLEEMKNKAINRIPGLEKQLPPSYDTLGNQREVYQDGGNNIFNVLLNPSFVSKYKPSKEANLVLDLFNQTGDKSIAPRNAQKYLMVDGQKIELTGKQHSEYQKLMGEELNKILISHGPSIEKMSTEQAIKEINNILTHVGKKAREELKTKDENIKKEIELINKMKGK